MFPDLRPVMSLTQLDVPAVHQVTSPTTETPYIWWERGVLPPQVAMLNTV